ncbi:MAG: hypothetical protein VYC39_04260 [Myxococcota bacterium]|nr:hypothetical protein [Myxococcota bacterium]
MKQNLQQLPIWGMTLMFFLGCSRTELALDGRPNKDGVRVVRPATDGGLTLSDASAGPDAAVPMPGVDAGVSFDTFRLTVYDNGEVIPGVEVIFHDQDGDFRHYQRTDRDGTVERTVKPDSLVTVFFRPDDNEPDLEYTAITYSGIQPGEHIHVGSRVEENGGDVYPVRLELDNIPRDIGGVFLSIGCEQELPEIRSRTVEFELEARCLDSEGRVSFLLSSTRSRRTPELFSFQRNVSIAKNGETVVRFDNWNRADEQEIEIQLDDVPQSTSWFYFEAGAVVEERKYRSAQTQSEGPSAELAIPGGISSEHFFRAAFVVGREEISAYTIYASPPQTMSDHRLSGTDDFLNLITSVDVRRSARSERPIMTWVEESGSSLQPDGRFAQMLILSEGGRSVRWMAVIDPKYDGQFDFPEMPPQMDEFEWINEGRIDIWQLVSLKSELFGGYETFKRDYGPRAMDPNVRGLSETYVSLGGSLGF